MINYTKAPTKMKNTVNSFGFHILRNHRQSDRQTYGDTEFDTNSEYKIQV